MLKYLNLHLITGAKFYHMPQIFMSSFLYRSLIPIEQELFLIYTRELEKSGSLDMDPSRSKKSVTKALNKNLKTRGGGALYNLLQMNPYKKSPRQLFINQITNYDSDGMIQFFVLKTEAILFNKIQTLMNQQKKIT